MNKNYSFYGEAEILQIEQRSELEELLDKIFLICLICLIMIANVIMGCELDLSIIWGTVKKPVPVLIGFLCQFLFMPLLAYTIAMLVFQGHEVSLLAFGLFVAGCSPGGGASNYWTILLEGNTNLSIAMTFFSTICAMVMMTFWIRMFGAQIMESINPAAILIIPYQKIVGSLFVLVVPLFIGLGVAKLRSNWAVNMRKIMRPFIVAVLIFIIAFGSANNFWLLKIVTWRILLAGMLLPLFGFILGFLCAFMFKQSRKNVIAIAIETCVQNTGIAIMVLKLTFPGPQGDLASLMPIVMACFTPLPLLLAYIVRQQLKMMKMRKNVAQSTNDGVARQQGQNLLEMREIQAAFFDIHLTATM